MDVRERTTANRRVLADFFDGLDDGQLARRSLCEAWTVRVVLGHLVMPVAGSARGFVRELVRQRGSLDRASTVIATELSRRPVGELTALLRDRADQHGSAPGVGPMGQMADGCLHLRDCARPLGLPDTVGPDDWRMLLDWLPSGVPGLVPKRRTKGLRLIADDQDWSWGAGEVVSGTSEALAMAVAGRLVALDDLAGPGAVILRERISARG